MSESTNAGNSPKPGPHSVQPNSGVQPGGGLTPQVPDQPFDRDLSPPPPAKSQAQPGPAKSSQVAANATDPDAKPATGLDPVGVSQANESKSAPKVATEPAKTGGAKPPPKPPAPKKAEAIARQNEGTKTTGPANQQAADKQSAGSEEAVKPEEPEESPTKAEEQPSQPEEAEPAKPEEAEPAKPEDQTQPAEAEEQPEEPATTEPQGTLGDSVEGKLDPEPGETVGPIIGPKGDQVPEMGPVEEPPVKPPLPATPESASVPVALLGRKFRVETGENRELNKHRG